MKEDGSGWKWTFCPIIMIWTDFMFSKSREDTMYISVDDLYSGSAMTLGVCCFVENIKPPSIDVVCPFDKLWFIDKSRSEVFGALVITPVSFTLAVYIYSVECRRKVEYWRNAAYIHPLHVGQGQNTDKLDLKNHVRK